MKNQLKTIIFFGTDEFSLAALQNLVENDYKIAAVVTKPDAKSGRGQKISFNPVKSYALNQNITVWQPNKVSDINEDIKSLGVNLVGVLVVFGKIIPKSTIDLFENGIINIHPSLLPKYRGPSPIESAILNNDVKTGISIMQIDTGMDSGPVYSQIDYILSGNETRPELYNMFAKLGAELLTETLPSILDGSLQSVQQNHKLAVYCKLLSKHDGQLDPKNASAKSAECMVRAYLSYPKTKITIQNYNVIITKAHVSAAQISPLDIKFADGNILSIDELIAPSGRKVTARDFINGYL